MSKEKDTNSLINDIVNDINHSKEKHEYSVTLNKVLDIPSLKSGSISLDKAMGNGFPLGRVVVVFGKYSNGKSSIAESVASEC